MKSLFYTLPTLPIARDARRFVSLVLVTALAAGCAQLGLQGGPRTTERDRTAKGAGIGAAAGAVGAVLKGKREADEILAGAAIGAVVGAGVGAYMDEQQEKLARIPGTTAERVGEDTLLVHFDSDVLFAGRLGGALARLPFDARAGRVGDRGVRQDRRHRPGSHRLDRHRGAQPVAFGAAGGLGRAPSWSATASTPSASRRSGTARTSRWPTTTPPRAASSTGGWTCC